MKFQKLELFSGSPGMFPVVVGLKKITKIFQSLGYKEEVDSFWIHQMNILGATNS